MWYAAKRRYGRGAGRWFGDYAECPIGQDVYIGPVKTREESRDIARELNQDNFDEVIIHLIARQGDVIDVINTCDSHRQCGQHAWKLAEICASILKIKEIQSQ